MWLSFIVIFKWLGKATFVLNIKVHVHPNWMDIWRRNHQEDETFQMHCIYGSLSNGGVVINFLIWQELLAPIGRYLSKWYNLFHYFLFKPVAVCYPVVQQMYFARGGQVLSLSVIMFWELMAYLNDTAF